MTPIPRRGLAGALALASATLSAAPDEEPLGRSKRYPVPTFGPAFGLFDEAHKIGTFSHMDEVFWPRRIAAAAAASPLPPGPPLPARERAGLFGQELIVQPQSGVVIVMTPALQTGDVPPDVFVERNYFTGAVIKALGGAVEVVR